MGQDSVQNVDHFQGDVLLKLKIRIYFIYSCEFSMRNILNLSFN